MKLIAYFRFITYNKTKVFVIIENTLNFSLNSNIFSSNCSSV